MAYWQDDTFDTWPEVYRVGTSAVGLYSRCGVYCARELTDGHIPLELVTSYGTREWAQKLVEVGLWEIEETGYRDVYFLYGKKGNKLNPTRDEAMAKLKAAADRTARWRANSKNGKKGVTHHVQESDASRDGIRDASSDASPSLPPSKEGKGTRAPASQGAARVPQTPHHPPSDEVILEDPRVIAEAEEQLRLDAEAAVAAIAEHQQRTARGAAAARAAIPKPKRSNNGTSGLDRLREAVADLPPLSEPPGDPPDELLRPPDPAVPADQPTTTESR